MDYIIDNNIILAIKMLHDNGYDAYIVGGAVRDLILDLPIADYDIVTNASLNIAKEIFIKYNPKLYSNNITLGVGINHTFFELSSYKGNTLEEDLLNRDFSINSIAYDIDKGLIDPYNGIYDLSKKIIKTIKDPKIVIEEDPIRILRALRFMEEKKFNIDSKLNLAINKYAYLLKNVKNERINKELNAILLSRCPSYYFINYKNVFMTLFDKYDIENITIIDNIKSSLVFRLTALGYLFKDISYTKFILEKYAYKNSVINQIIHILEYIDYQLFPNEDNILEFLFKFKLEDLDLYFGLRRAILLANNMEIYEMDLIASIARKLILENKIITNANLRIHKKDLINLGYKEEDIDKVLLIILKKVINKELVNDRDKLFDYACKLKYDFN